MTVNTLTLCRHKLPEKWLMSRGHLLLSEPQFATAIPEDAIAWIERAEVERDPGYKQLIPYIIVRWGDRLALYSRQGNEKRLHGCCSVGVGGHVDECDDRDDLCSTLFSAARRELREELPGLPKQTPLCWLGIINEEETSVGHTHLGIVLLADAYGSNPPVGGDELGALNWLTIDQIDHDSLEIWSQLALELLRCYQSYSGDSVGKIS